MISNYALSFIQDVVGVYNGFEQVFRAARPIKASVREESKLMEHPKENGETVVDHQVFQSVVIDLQLVLDSGKYRDTYKEIKGLYRQGQILRVQTRADSYQNMVIEALPHEEDPAMFNSIALTLRLKEISIVTAQYEAVYAPKNPAQSATADRGEKQPKQAGSWASRNILTGR